MTSVTAHAIEYAIENGLKRANFSTGADQSKLRWRPEEIVMRTFSLHEQTLRARVAHQAVEVGKTMRARWEKRRRTVAVRDCPLGQLALRVMREASWPIFARAFMRRKSKRPNDAR